MCAENICRAGLHLMLRFQHLRRRCCIAAAGLRCGGSKGISRAACRSCRAMQASMISKGVTSFDWDPRAWKHMHAYRQGMHNRVQ